MKFTPSDAPRLVLIDTNILISAIDPREEGRARFVAPIVSALSDAGRVATCAQVVGEFFDSATRANGKIAPVFSRLEGQRFAADLVDAYTYLETTEAVSLSALHASIRYQMRFYDAELWAIARIWGIRIILTEDMQSAGVIEGVRYVNPFAPAFRPALVGL